MNSLYLDEHLNVGTITYPPGGTYGPRVQSDYQLVMVHTGDLQVTIDSTVYHVPKGHVALLTPGHTEFFTFAQDEATWHSWISLRRPQLTAAQWESLTQAPRCLPLSPAMQSYADLALADHDLPTIGPLLLALGHDALLLYLGEAQRRSSAPPTDHPAVSAGRQYMREHAIRQMTLAEIALAAGVTPAHLIRLFRRHLGTTPMAYLWSERTRRGVDLLHHSGLSVAQVAERVGFSTPFHFSRRVKQQTGLSPTALRRAAWQPRLAPEPGSLAETGMSRFGTGLVRRRPVVPGRADR
jgi:AraC family transcriptional regulator of arabinose operon